MFVSIETCFPSFFLRAKTTFHTNWPPESNSLPDVFLIVAVKGILCSSCLGSRTTIVFFNDPRGVYSLSGNWKRPRWVSAQEFISIVCFFGPVHSFRS